MIERARELIHDTAVIIRQLKPKVENFTRDVPKVDAVLSKEERSKALISAINAVLQMYGEPPVEKVSGYDVLIIDDILTDEQACSTCSDPLRCPFRGTRFIPEVGPQGIFAKQVYCERHYRAHLINEIEYLADKEIPALKGKTTAELVELRDKLKRRLKR